MRDRTVDRNIEKKGFFVYFYYNDKTYYLSKLEDTYYFSNTSGLAFIYKDLVDLSNDYRIMVNTYDGLFAPEIWEKILNASIGEVKITYGGSVKTVLDDYNFLMKYIEEHPFS